MLNAFFFTLFKIRKLTRSAQVFSSKYYDTAGVRDFGAFWVELKYDLNDVAWVRDLESVSVEEHYHEATFL